MSITITTLADVCTTWALPELKDAQKRFNKHPNAANWQACLRAMLTYQQISYAAGRPVFDDGKLLFDLESNPIGHWQDVICRNTIGLTCAEALRAHA